MTRTWLTMVVDELELSSSDDTAVPALTASGANAATGAIDHVNANAL